jgi:translation elongation factor EF-Tu-like GTPase
MMEEVEIGRVSHYFAHIEVAAVTLEKDSIKIGDKLHFKGHTTDFEQVVESMQIEHDAVEKAAAGDSVGIRVQSRVRPHDAVYKVIV